MYFGKLNEVVTGVSWSVRSQIFVVDQTQSGSSTGRGGNLSLTSDSDNEESQNNRKKSLNFKQRKSKWVGKATLSFINQVFSRGGTGYSIIASLVNSWNHCNIQTKV